MKTISKIHVSLKVNTWFIFGRYDDNHVDISDKYKDVFEHVPEEIANKLIAARERHIDEVHKILNGLDE